jgi:superfamily II DNA/RNA helicase
MTAAEKDRAIEQFAADAEVLVSTEVGGQGRNLQFCRTVVNYDLP